LYKNQNIITPYYIYQNLKPIILFLNQHKYTKRLPFSPDRNGILFFRFFFKREKKIEWMAGIWIADKAQAIRSLKKVFSVQSRLAVK
jgi:hypothetical protein